MMDRLQINVRLTQELIEQLDRKRIEMQPQLGKIPSRSDVVRYALERFLGESSGTAPNQKPSAKARAVIPSKQHDPSP